MPRHRNRPSGGNYWNPRSLEFKRTGIKPTEQQEMTECAKKDPTPKESFCEYFCAREDIRVSQGPNGICKGRCAAEGYF